MTRAVKILTHKSLLMGSILVTPNLSLSRGVTGKVSLSSGSCGRAALLNDGVWGEVGTIYAALILQKTTIMTVGLVVVAVDCLT